MKRFLSVYLGFSVLEVVAELLRDSYPLIHYFTKPILMVLLFFFLWTITQKSRTKTDILMLVSIVFAWLGDVFLLFRAELFFLLGLSAFLITHLIYIYVFQKEASLKNKGFAILTLLLSVCYGTGLMYLVFPSLPAPLKVPVVVYALTILMMVWVMMLRYRQVSAAAFRTGLAGGLMFMISDSLIAISSFTQIKVPYPSVGIMALYLAGQYCLIDSYVISSGRAE
ncbi:MAG: lysoplasmalogenase [Bacteroidia bacterium]|nr:lysoplasmalogenase [Bacteroidia bacterium]